MIRNRKNNILNDNKKGHPPDVLLIISKDLKIKLSQLCLILSMKYIHITSVELH